MTRPTQSSLVNSGIAAHQILPDVHNSSSFNLSTLALRYPNTFRNASAINKSEVGQFYRIGPKIGYHSITTWILSRNLANSRTLLSISDLDSVSFFLY